MKTIHQIQIQSPINDDYSTTISVCESSVKHYVLVTLIKNKGKINQFLESYETYNKAINAYLEQINEYAQHTAIMNL